MFMGVNRLLVAAAVVAGVVLVAPTAALACGGGPSAKNVYKECALPNGGGGGTNPTGPETSGSGHSNPVPSRILQTLDETGKDKPVLSAMLKGYGLRRHLQAHASEASAAPSALGSAFDLRSGPTVLLIVLVGTAALLLGGSGLRVWRTRHRP